MKFVQRIGRIMVMSVVVAVAVAVAGGAEATYAAEAKTITQKEKVYAYTAQQGDSYTQLVRKAVQTYGIDHKVDLGNARIVAIETKASEQAGWPAINEGQGVSFNESLLKTWVDEAKKMTEADVAAWATYVPYIDFDTRSIGQ